MVDASDTRVAANHLDPAVARLECRVSFAKVELLTNLPKVSDSEDANMREHLAASHRFFVAIWLDKFGKSVTNKLASLGATLVRNSAH